METIKTYLLLDNDFKKIEVIEKMFFLLTKKEFHFTKVNNVYEVDEMSKDEFSKIYVSILTMKHDLELKQLLLVITPFYDLNIVDLINIKSSGVLSINEIMFKNGNDSQTNIDFSKSVFDNIPAYILDTVKTYIDFNESTIETSKVMFTHRNTISYRINKFIQLTSINVRDISNAILVRYMLQVFLKNQEKENSYGV